MAGRNRRSDERMADHVHDLLTDDPDLDATNIRVEVHEGDVTLSGSVSTRWAKGLAEAIVDQCSGVHRVENRLSIAAQEPIGKASE